MKNLIFFFLLQLILPQFCQSQSLEEIWNKYLPDDMKAEMLPDTPGIIYGELPETATVSFSEQWKYRPGTFEMYFQNPESLARGIRSLALYAHDISPDLPAEKFYKGVTGFHYSVQQIADWLNSTFANNVALIKEESELVGELLRNSVLTIGNAGFAPGGKIKHILGAAPGKSRTLEQTLLHERLHVFWDEDEQMRARAHHAWQQLTESQKAEIRKRLRNYDQNNEAQLVEEWAILDAERTGLKIK